MMNTFKTMQVFCRIVELGSFAAVARERQVSAMMISKYMRSLEDSLGISLINRNTRQLYVTELGQDYYQKCKRLLEDLNDLESSMSESRQKISGILKINAPIDFGGLYMVAAIDAFQKKYPDVHVLMTLNNGFVNLRDSQFDLAIVVTDTLDEGVVARRIAQTPLCTYAAPSYLAEYGEPKTIASLKQQRCLHYSDTPHKDAWIFNDDGKSVEIKPQWVFASNNGGVLCQAASLGMGVMRSPALSVRDYLQSGELVEILEPYRVSDLSIYVTYLQRNYYPIKMSCFIDFLVDYFVDE